MRQRTLFWDKWTDDHWVYSSIWNQAYWYGRDVQHQVEQGMSKGPHEKWEKRIGQTKSRHIYKATGTKLPMVAKSLYHKGKR